MRWRVRPESVPSDVRDKLSLESGERVLASGLSSEGTWFVGTDRCLYIVSDEVIRLPWERVERASWDRDSSELVVEEVADFGTGHPRHTALFDDPRRLLELLRERVTASVLLTQHVPVAGSRGIKVVARRSPLRTGDIEFSYVLANGLDPDDEAVREAGRRGVAAVRADLGL